MGAALDCRWVFGEDIKEPRLEVIQRLSVLRKVANALRSFERRILSATSHALIASVANYGEAALVTHCGQAQAGWIDSSVLRKAARKIIGTGLSAGRAVLHVLADPEFFTNDYPLQTANMVGRVLRAGGATPQDDIKSFFGSLEESPRKMNDRSRRFRGRASSTTEALEGDWAAHLGQMRSETGNNG